MMDIIHNIVSFKVSAVAGHQVPRQLIVQLIKVYMRGSCRPKLIINFKLNLN
jgi:hypothetical protein